jgi:hypothetical protein
VEIMQSRAPFISAPVFHSVGTAARAGKPIAQQSLILTYGKRDEHAGRTEPPKDEIDSGSVDRQRTRRTRSIAVHDKKARTAQWFARFARQEYRQRHYVLREQDYL